MNEGRKLGTFTFCVVTHSFHPLRPCKNRALADLLFLIM